MTHVLPVVRAVARRSIHITFTNPALLLPSLLFPLIFLLAFAGGLSSVSNVPGFDFPSGYTAFQFVFVFLQAAAFSGVFTGFGIARDFETGFARRLLLAAPSRPAILLGYAVAGQVRMLFTFAVITVAGLIGGMQIDGSPLDLLGLIVLGLMVNLASMGFAAGIATRTRTLQAGPFMQIPVFLMLFLAPVYVPLDLLSGWLHTAASWNPATAALETGRGFISGVDKSPALAFACIAGLIAVCAVFALRGLRKAEAAGG